MYVISVWYIFYTLYFNKATTQNGNIFSKRRLGYEIFIGSHCPTYAYIRMYVHMYVHSRVLETWIPFIQRKYIVALDHQKETITDRVADQSLSNGLRVLSLLK